VEAIFEKYRIDTVVYFAAKSHVDRSILGPDAFIKTNVTGSFVLLETARNYWRERDGAPERALVFHHISTDEVYGSRETGAFSETRAPMIPVPPIRPVKPPAITWSCLSPYLRAAGNPSRGKAPPGLRGRPEHPGLDLRGGSCPGGFDHPPEGGSTTIKRELGFGRPWRGPWAGT
jgi:hypothetical protein